MKGNEDEKNLSAESNQTIARSWISSADEDPERASRFGPAASEGAVALGRGGDHEAGSGHSIGMSYTFGREKRILTGADFRRVLRHGARVKGEHFVAVALPVRGRGAARRLGLTVSRKVGCAVERNRLKRRVRELFRLNYEHLLQSVDFVVIAQPGAAQLSFGEIRAELCAMHERLPRALVRRRRGRPHGRGRAGQGGRHGLGR